MFTVINTYEWFFFNFICMVLLFIQVNIVVLCTALLSLMTKFFLDFSKSCASYSSNLFEKNNVFLDELSERAETGENGAHMPRLAPFFDFKVL